MIADPFVFEPAEREVPFSDEAAEVREAKATARDRDQPLLVILRRRHMMSETAVEALQPSDLRCPEWMTEADRLWVIVGDRLHVIRGEMV